jgi:predicted kinase
MLVVLGGLPGSGKTTVGIAVAEMLTAAYVRIDALEAAMWRAGIAREQPTGVAATSSPKRSPRDACARERVSSWTQSTRSRLPGKPGAI